ncbi:hypothetical protein, partial [Amycolatopsis magusensis]|uniref:hypothetical protein n=1 Tax=Amycolatopsis magusensis TaxID=882444 RepID=UPI0024A8D617
CRAPPGRAPRAGRRAVPYLVVLGTLLTALAALGGLLAAVLCHSGHNLVLSATARRRSGRAPAGLPPSRTWS